MSRLMGKLFKSLKALLLSFNSLLFNFVHSVKIRSSNTLDSSTLSEGKI